MLSRSEANVFKRHNLFALSLILLIFFQSVFSIFAWSDDWGIYEEPNSHTEHAIKDGRPLFGYLLPIQFSLTNGNLNLFWLARLPGIVSILGTFFIFSATAYTEIKRLNNHKKTRFLPYFLILPFLTLSHFWIASWATISTWGFSMLISTLGAYYLIKVKHKVALYKKVLLTIILSISNLIYPLYTLYGLSLFVTLIIFQKDESRIKEIRKRIIIFLFSYALSLLFSAAAVRIGTIKKSLVLNEKVTQFVSIEDLPEKLEWFVSRPLLISLTPLNYMSSSVHVAFHIMLMITLVLMLCYHLYYLGSFNRMKATTTIFLFSVSFWPIIVTPQNQIDHRLLLVPTSIFLSFVSSSTYVVYSSHPIKRKTTVAALLYFFFIFVSYTNIKELGSEVLIDPFEKVRGSIKSEVQRCSNENTLREIVFHKTYYRDYNPYIGNLSTVSDINHPWTLKPLIQIIIQNDFPKLKGIRVTEFARKVEEEPRFESFSKACIIDFDSFFQSDGL